MKKIFIIASTLCLILCQEINAQEIKADTTIRPIDLKLEKLGRTYCNGMLSGIFGVMFAGIGYSAYKNAISVEKNTSDYILFKTHYENKAKMGKGMMIGGGILALIGGGVVITTQKKIKINLAIRN